MDEVSIRLASLNDLKAIQDLNHELFVSDNKHFDDLNIEWPYQKVGEDYFKETIQSDKAVCFLAEIDSQPIGYLAGWVRKEHAAYKGLRAEIDNMCVTKNYRSKGVGKALVAAFYEWCKGKKVDFVVVTAFAPNQKAIEFYRKQGLTDYSLTMWHKL